MRVCVRVVSLALLVTLAFACSSDNPPKKVDRLMCESLGAKESYHVSSYTAFVVTDTGTGATPAPNDFPPFDVSWAAEVDVVESGDAARGAVTTQDGGSVIEKEVIQVGSDVWTTLGPDGDFVQVPGGSSPIPFPPSETCQALIDDLDLVGMEGAAEKVNGINSLKYDIDALPSTALADVPSIGGGADAVQVVKQYDGAIWVASDGYISKLELSGAGDYEGGRQRMSVEMAFEYSDINNVDTEVRSPVPLAPGQP